MGGGRTARTDQSDTGMCLCRGAGGASIPRVGSQNPGQEPAEPGWGVGMGMRPLPEQLCHNSAFSWGLAPGLDALSSGG